ncbi:hypothetical protein CHU98_g5585 [Xylaria longipes]|nr:hypothetical protein CHU98_g5585 [Xylaria longipes]
MLNNNPGFRHHSHQNTSPSVISHYRAPLPQVPLAPVARTEGQSRERPQISQDDRIRKKKFEEYLINSEGSPGKRTEVILQKQSIEKPSAEPPSPLSLSTESSPHPGRPQNLGTRDEALHSHPTRTCVGRSVEKPPQVDERTKKMWRKVTIYDNKFMEPEPSPDHLVERQQDLVFSTKASENSFQEFPNPAIWETKEEVNFEQTAASTIPAIRIIPPSESSADQNDQRSLSRDSAHQRLHRRAETTIRRLKHRLGQVESFVPLARLTAKAARVDVTDGVALEKELKVIIQDRSDLAKLRPLADALCTYRDINYSPEVFESLPLILHGILGDLKKARFEAAHYKRAAKGAQGRNRQLQDYIRRLLHDDEDEDYIRQVDTATRAVPAKRVRWRL